MDSRRIDVTIDDKKITSKGKKIELKIDGEKVYSTDTSADKSESDIKASEWVSVKSLIKASNSAFGHNDRFRIVKSLVESPKSFTEIKNLLTTTSPTVNFHLKKLIDGMIVYKTENGNYALTLLGELLFEFFSRFLKEAILLNEEIQE
jgi:DNA-binding HxlR family transcriptional regulator